MFSLGQCSRKCPKLTQWSRLHPSLCRPFPSYQAMGPSLHSPQTLLALYHPPVPLSLQADCTLVQGKAGRVSPLRHLHFCLHVHWILQEEEHVVSCSSHRNCEGVWDVLHWGLRATKANRKQFSSDIVAKSYGNYQHIVPGSLFIHQFCLSFNEILLLTQ